MGFTLGLDAKLYYNSATEGSPTWVEITPVRDLTLNMDAATADVTTRASGGWRMQVPTLKEVSLDFQMIWDPSDAGFAVIHDAYIANSTVELLILDGPEDTAGSEGMRGSFGITAVPRNEALEDALMCDVSAVLAPNTTALWDTRS